EDGIRDWSVTGVQTCALPISGPRPAPLPGRRADPGATGRLGGALLALVPAQAPGGGSDGGGAPGGNAVRRAGVAGDPERRRGRRSEERRVGKEGGAGGARDR